MALSGGKLEKQPRLILVDDEPVILRLLTQVFRDSAFVVVPCSTGSAAIEAMKDGVDVLLTDKNLPDISGLQILERARADWPDCEVLLITGYASLDTALTAMELGAFDYIVKPPRDIYEVRRRVEQAWTKVRMGRENRALLARLSERNAELEAALVALRDAQDELIQSEKLAGIGTLAAGVAHEVSSPLFGVLGLAEAILDEEDRGLVDGYAREIASYVGSIKEIVTQLTGYSRSAGEAAVAPVAFGQVAAEAAKLVCRTVGFEPERLRLGGDLDAMVVAKGSELQQVMVNLLKNSVEAVQQRYPDHGGSVEVQAQVAGDALVVTITDDGDGIEPSQISAIFDPFFTTKPPGRGTGLGLNIVYRIVTRYRGSISVQSTVGQGTVFTLRLPLHAADSSGA